MNITKDAAMDERSAFTTMTFGMEAIASETDLLCIGEMGVGNTKIASVFMFSIV
ncbi:hypothetical protein O9A_00929 [Bartonella koehlerae C-29]|uniref:Nicotinate-nucleotide--dimethylbenzimidazole phosphoribosyltransferase n=1 Tax=Bartonella koehlerae C-29 TaxID=1134510 RepID=A0A067W5P6_9HYPH|nr:hypothetical protein O9A_00929 [Bartonella koehlerae C-29]